MVDIFIHPTAEVQTKNIGRNTTVWQYAIILANAKIGNNCNINSHTFIENDVIIGDNVTVKCGVYLWNGLRIEDNIFIGPNATFTNDKFPRSKEYPEVFSKIIIRKGASIGGGGNNHARYRSRKICIGGCWCSSNEEYSRICDCCWQSSSSDWHGAQS